MRRAGSCRQTDLSFLLHVVLENDADKQRRQQALCEWRGPNPGWRLGAPWSGSLAGGGARGAAEQRLQRLCHRAGGRLLCSLPTGDFTGGEMPGKAARGVVRDGWQELLCEKSGSHLSQSALAGIPLSSFFQVRWSLTWVKQNRVCTRVQELSSCLRCSGCLPLDVENENFHKVCRNLHILCV